MTFIAKRGHVSSFLIDALSASKLDDVLVHMRNPLSDSNARVSDPLSGGLRMVWTWRVPPRVIAMTS